MLASVLASLSLLAWTAAMPAAARGDSPITVEPEEEGQPEQCAKNLLQTKTVQDTSKTVVEQAACANLGIFFDGTTNNLNMTCKFNNSQNCESNVAALWRLAISNASQKLHYEPGVGTLANDSAVTGKGVKQHMLNAYKWLVKNYEPCDKIFIFAFSRGTLSARMLSGLINRVGIAKHGMVDTVVKAHFEGGNTTAVQANKSLVWPGNESRQVEFMGMFDGVLGTLADPVAHKDIESLHLQMNPGVKALAHALALDEYTENMDAHTLAVDKRTQQKQVWFLGTHLDVGGGYPNKGPAHIAAGWIADQASEWGFLFPADWRDLPEMDIDYMDDVFTDNGVDAGGFTVAGWNMHRGLDLMTIRDPARCREKPDHPYHGEKLHIHKSVFDRMRANEGWEPLNMCCEKIRENIVNTGYDFVENPHYTKRQPFVQAVQHHWMKIKVFQVRKLQCMWNNPRFYLTLVNWAGQPALTDSGHAPQGCCQAVKRYPPAGQNPSCRWTRRKGKLNFGGMDVILPAEDAMAHTLLVEVGQDNGMLGSSFVDRVKIDLGSPDIGTSKKYVGSNGVEIFVKVNYLTSDDEARDYLPGEGHANCRWLMMQSGKSMSELCTPSGQTFMPGMTMAKTCTEFIEDIKTGAL